MKDFEGYRHGINFGGWFSQCDNTEKRYDNFIKKEDFRRVKRWGLDHVRIPIDYNLVQNLDGSFKQEGLKRIEDCILWCKEYNLNIILDLHKTIGFSFDVKEGEKGFFEDETLQEYFYLLWEEFARRFSGYGNVAFELLNEVSEYRFKDTWNRIIHTCIERIRKYAPDIKILVGGYYNNSIEAIKDLDVPYDENIVYNFHCYSPLIFTHQGAYWINKMPLDFRMSFDESTDKYTEYTNKYIGKEYLDEFKEDSHIDESYFEDLFKEAFKICQERGVALYCGEYGVIDRVEPKEAIKWYRCFLNVLEKHNVGRAAWSYKEMDFGLVDAHYDDIREEMLKLL